MNCTTSFTVPYPDNTEMRYEKMDCQTALKFMQEFPPPCGYLNKTEIIALKRFFSNTENYVIASKSQFECHLNCGVNSQSGWEYLKCKRICQVKQENVMLNELDAMRLGKHPPA
jgi:hypothetical protein